jgi:glycosyltransferase involved in cell wall biosynthesis
MDESSEAILVFDMRSERWVRRIATPPELAHSHCAVAADGKRFIYMVSGQLGPQCRPAVRDAFAYDTIDDRWHRLPPLPEPRYAAAMEVWRGRLHVIGGAAADRWTPTADHWSLDVAGGAAGGEWRTETPIPVAGMHRASAVVGDTLYVLGGQQGDFQAIPGDPECRCSGRTRETYLACGFRLDDPSGAWTPVADMPIATSHCDFATLVVDDRVLLLGGQIYKDPHQFYLRISDTIQVYDVAEDRWTILDYLPYRLKIPVAGRLGDKLIVATGQRGKGDGDKPDRITSDTWKAILPPAARGRAARRDGALAGKTLLMISHDLSRTGSPLLLMETARALIDIGADVRVASAADDVEGWTLASEFRVPRIPIETAIALAGDADVVVANTSSEPTKAWVRECLATSPGVARRLVWWIHEIDVERYRPGMEPVGDAALALFDSEAARSAWAGTVSLPADARVVHPALSEAFVETAAQQHLPFPEDRRRTRSPRCPRLGREEIRARLGVAPDDFLLCSIGTFVPHKGQRMLIRTVARAAAERGLALKLAIVGFRDSAQRAAVLGQLTTQERRVLSPSRAYVNQAEYAAFYLASDAFVMNSQGEAGRGECFGRVTVEAMAFGLPVLGTAAGGTTEIVSEGVTGLLFPLGEDGQGGLADHIENLARNPALAQALGRAGRERALGHFRQERFLAELGEAVASLG